MTTEVFRKERLDAPSGFFACEAAGLRWLAAAGGVRVVQVLRVDPTGLDLERLRPDRPDAACARALGAGLAVLHAAGAPAYGAPPEGWSGDGFFGPMDQPLPLPADSSPTWGAFYARSRIVQVQELLERAGRSSRSLAAVLDAVRRRLERGDWDDDEPPARLHGDLWSGNVVWTAEGAVLIDPAAHGGHPLTDLAMLDLFGLPHLEEVLAGYEAVRGLPDGWRDLLSLHQLYPVGMHAVLFGGGYGAQLAGLAARYA
jgi:fructosamine-3-kinase